MKLRVRRTLLYYVPLIGNVLLASYLGWQLTEVTPFERDSRVFMFAVMYGLGGMVIAISGVTAFLHVTAQLREPRSHYALSLLNIIVPTVLLLVMLNMT